MTIHIIEVAGDEAAPSMGSILATNCAKQLPFTGGIDASWDDGRVCSHCLRIHRSLARSRLNAGVQSIGERPSRTIALLEFEEGEKEHCVLCRQETGYRKSTPIDQREHYVDGSGQLCRMCYLKIYDAVRE